MKIKKNVNINSAIERLKQLQGEAGALINSLTEANNVFSNTKLGVGELNLGIEEELMRFANTYSKIEELIKGL